MTNLAEQFFTRRPFKTWAEANGTGEPFMLIAVPVKRTPTLIGVPSPVQNISRVPAVPILPVLLASVALTLMIANTLAFLCYN